MSTFSEKIRLLIFGKLIKDADYDVFSVEHDDFEYDFHDLDMAIFKAVEMKKKYPNDTVYIRLIKSFKYN